MRWTIAAVTLCFALLPGEAGAEGASYVKTSDVTLKDMQTVLYQRDEKRLTGGTVGFVNASVRNECDSGVAVLSYLWCGLDILRNYSREGENVARYMQAARLGEGPVWASVSEAEDPSNTDNPDQAVLGQEIDVERAGLDSNYRSIGTDYVFRAPLNYPVPSGGWKPTEVGYGIRMQADLHVADGGLRTPGSVRLKTGILFAVPMEVGVDCRPSNVSDSCMRLADGQRVSFSTDGHAGIYYSDNVIHFSSGIATPLGAPGSSKSPCYPGQSQDDINFHYVCVAANHWRRVRLEDF